MKKYILFLILIPVVLFAREYSIDELIGRGIKDSYTAQSSSLNYESSASQLSTAKWNLLPEAALGATADYRFYNPSALPGASDMSTSFGISISKAISLNDASWFNYRQAKLNEESAQIRLTSNLRNYVYQVFGAYLDVLNAERQLLSLNENLKIQTRIWEQSKALLAQGRTTDFEVKQNEIAMMNSRISILKMQNTIDKSRKILFGQLGMQDEGFPLQEITNAGMQNPPELDLNNIEAIRLLQQESLSSELTLSQAKLDYLPRVTLSYALSRSVSGADIDFDQYSTSHGVNLSLSYSLWNQFRQSETVKRSKITKQMNLLSINEKKDEIRREYDSIIEELSYLNQLDQLYRERLNQSQEQIRIAEERYRLGMIQQLELDKTRSEYLDADIAYNSNRYQILSKQEALNYLLSHKILGKW